jgi:hypothetical protein
MDRHTLRAHHGCMEDGYRDLSALPRVAPASDESTSPPLVIEVDGETFAARSDGFGGTHYDWLSGVNPGYGFASSPTPSDWSLEEHRACIRNFLDQIDPATGFIGED